MTDVTVKKWWWLSFSSEAGWLGGVAVAAETFPEAHIEACLRGVNPGGEVKGIKLGEAPEEKLLPLVPHRLYSKAELEEIDGGLEKF